MDKLFDALCGLIAAFLMAIMNAAIFSKLWIWFITPAFAVKVPTYPILYGLIICASFLTHSSKSSDRPMIDVIIEGLTKSFAIFVIAWLVQAIFM